MKKAKWRLAIAFVITMLGVFIAFGIQTDGGKVSIKSINIASEDGKVLSALLYIPNTATNQTPAPAVLAVHGYVNVKEHMTNYALELARRGYVVLTPDMSGHGYSERSAVDGALMSEGATGGVNDSLTALYNMPFVDKANISLIGHSMGAFNCQIVEMMNPDKVKALGLLGYCPLMNITAKCNVAVVLSQYDESGHFFLNDAKTIPEGKDSQNMMTLFNTTDSVAVDKLYGSFEDGTARQWFMPKNTHPGDLFNKEPIANIISFLQNSSPAPNPVQPDNQIWKWHEFGTLIALLGFANSIFAVASLMFQTQYFGALVQKDTTNRTGLKGIFRWIGAVAVTAIPALTFLKFGNIGSKIKITKLLPIEYSNITFTWAVGTAIIFLILFLLWHFVTAKSSNENKMIAYGLSTSVTQSQFKWKTIGKSLLLTVITLGIPYTLLFIVYHTLHLDYRFIIVMFHPMDAIHFRVFLVYFIPSLIFFFASSLITNNWFRMKEFTGGKALIPYVVNAFIAVTGLIVLELIQYSTMFRTGAVKWGDSVSLMLGISAWQLIPLIAFATMIITYFYRKTANIYAGVLTSAALVAWYSVCINAINTVL